MTAPAKRKLAAIAIDGFLIGLFWINGTRTSYSGTAGRVLIGFYFLAIAVLSIERVRDWVSLLWEARTPSPTRKYWRWLTDDYPDAR